jgi:hypothetical protein
MNGLSNAKSVSEIGRVNEPNLFTRPVSEVDFTLG